MLLQAPKELFSPVCLLKHAEAATGAQAGGRLLWGSGRTGDRAPVNGAALPSLSSLPAQSHSHRLKGDAEGISLLLKKTSGVLLGFVVGGKSERGFAMWEAEERGEGVVCIEQRRKNPQPFVVVVSCNYF